MQIHQQEQYQIISAQTGPISTEMTGRIFPTIDSTVPTEKGTAPAAFSVDFQVYHQHANTLNKTS